MLSLGTPLPNFELPKVTGGLLKSSQLDHRPILIMVICAHCPYVKHIEPEISRLDKDYGEVIQMIAVSSNSLITHPEDSPKNLHSQARRLGWRFPYLHDENQELAKVLKAACTPEFYLFGYDKNPPKLIYRGQLDNSRPGNDQPLTGGDIRAAIDAVLAGKPVNLQQVASMGCNVKWNPGQEPEWFLKST